MNEMRERKILDLKSQICNLQFAICNSQSPRSGLTLVELLVVVGVVLMLASFSVGMMRNLMRGQKVNQAATLVQQYLQNAQIRAITNGRPVAVFLDRVSIAGDGALPIAGPIPANYMSTRLQLGEVFPPYIGDVANTVGNLVDVDNDGYADCLEFDTDSTMPNFRTRVLSGFGDFVGNQLIGGFVEPDDLIEIEGSSYFFAILDFRKFSSEPELATGQIRVPFVNHVTNFPNGTTSSTFGAIPPQLPLASPSTKNFRRFKVYRQPTKSLAGSITLPRGTCVDLSLSGFGPSNSGIVNGPFHLNTAPLPSGVPHPSYFSRAGIVFDAQGRMSYLIFEKNVGDGIDRDITFASSKLSLMVGRTDQVLPGFPVTSILEAAKKNADDGLPPSNLMDPENVWITCNPFTGNITASPVASVTVNPNVPFDENQHIRQSRQLATTGARN